MQGCATLTCFLIISSPSGKELGGRLMVGHRCEQHRGEENKPGVLSQQIPFQLVRYYETQHLRYEIWG